MQKKLLIASLFPVLILGAGCVSEPPTPEPQVQEPVKKIEVNLDQPSTYEPLCIHFKRKTGFMAWLNSYEKGDGGAVSLAVNIKLPYEAEPAFVERVRRSLNENNATRFFCVLDEEIPVYAWTADVLDSGLDECKGLVITSASDSVTIADIETWGIPELCKKICIPKYQTNEKLVWQCDVIKSQIITKWSELHMSRQTGETVAYGCLEDESGVTPGCVR